MDGFKVKCYFMGNRLERNVDGGDVFCLFTGSCGWNDGRGGVFLTEETLGLGVNCLGRGWDGGGDGG